jgi:hypothetical protein
LAAIGYRLIRASATDQDRVVEVIKSGFVEGRLTKQELDERVLQALGQRYFADLIALIDDLPAGVFARLPAHRATPTRRGPEGWCSSQ